MCLVHSPAKTVTFTINISVDVLSSGGGARVGRLRRFLKVGKLESWKFKKVGRFDKWNFEQVIHRKIYARSPDFSPVRKAMPSNSSTASIKRRERADPNGLLS